MFCNGTNAGIVTLFSTLLSSVLHLIHRVFFLPFNKNQAGKKKKGTFDVFTTHSKFSFSWSLFSRGQNCIFVFTTRHFSLFFPPLKLKPKKKRPWNLFFFCPQRKKNHGTPRMPSCVIVPKTWTNAESLYQFECLKNARKKKPNRGLFNEIRNAIIDRWVNFVIRFTCHVRTELERNIHKHYGSYSKVSLFHIFKTYINYHSEE